MKKSLLLTFLSLCVLALTSCRYADRQHAVAALENRYYLEALELLEPLADDADCAPLFDEACAGAFEVAQGYESRSEYFLALSTLDALPADYVGAAELRERCEQKRQEEQFALALSQMKEGRYESALETLADVSDERVPNASAKRGECHAVLSLPLDGVFLQSYNKARALAAMGRFDEACGLLSEAATSDYRDSASLLALYRSDAYRYDVGVSLMRLGSYERAASIFSALNYLDSEALATSCRELVGGGV